MNLIKLKKRLIGITLLLSGCSSLPPFPHVNQCGYSVKFNKFRCCDENGKSCFNLRREDPKMEGAQCLSGSDYKKASHWIDSVTGIAQQRCR